jgi:hypothetical protein
MSHVFPLVLQLRPAFGPARGYVRRPDVTKYICTYVHVSLLCKDSFIFEYTPIAPKSKSYPNTPHSAASEQLDASVRLEVK